MKPKDKTSVSPSKSSSKSRVRDVAGSSGKSVAPCEEALRRSEAILQAVSFAAERFLRGVTWEDHILDVLRMLGEAAGTSRVYLFEILPAPPGGGDREVELRFNWGAPNAPPPPLEGGRRVPLSLPGLKRFREYCEKEATISGLAVNFPPEEQALLQRHGVKSMAAAPIYSGEEWWGLIAFDDCVAERQWQNSEISAIEAAAGLLGAAIQRRRDEEALRRGETQNRLLLETFPDLIFHLNQEGVFLDYRAGNESDLLVPPALFIGNKVRDVLPPAVADLTMKAIRKALETHKPATYEYDLTIQNTRRLYESRVVATNDREVLAIIRDITERKRVEEALRRSEERFRTAAQCTSDLIYEWDIAADRLEWFGNIFERLGYAPFELPQTSKAWEIYIHEEDYPRVREAIDRHLSHGEPYFEDYRVVRKDGSIRYWRDSGTALPDPSGKPVRWIGASTDITERKQVEDALMHTEDLYRRAISQTGSVPYQRNFAHAWYTFLGDGIELLTGYTRQELTGPLFGSRVRRVDYYGPEKNMSASERLSLVNSGMIRNWRADYLFERKDGAQVWLSDSSVPVLDESGKTVGALGILTDITERKLVEEALRESEERHRLLVENVNDGIVISQNDRFISFNSRFAELLGYSPGELMMKDYREVYTPESLEILQKRKEKRDRGEEVPSRYETILRRRDGTKIEVEANVRIINYRDAAATFAVIRDITERKRLEDQLRQAQKMEAIGQLAGGVAHDFNNLLTGILGNLALAKMDSQGEVQEVLEEAERAGQRAVDLVKQLLAFGRKSAAVFQSVELGGILDEVAAMARKTFDRRIELMIRRPPELRHVWADPGQIHQVVLNLCVNARDAVQELVRSQLSPVMRINVDAENADIGPEYCSRHSEARQGRYVVIAVTDSGTGIDEATQRRIFEPFFTTKPFGKGTGLGLAVAYGIVKQHGGWINVYSEVGKGSTFKVYLPAAEGKTNEEKTELDAPKVPGGKETILIVDDESYIRRLGRRILERLGYRIIEAEDGREALDIYTQREKDIDLVILDLSMPRLSGVETLLHLKEMNPAVKVILSSGYAKNGQGNMPEAYAETPYILKPYQPPDLAKIVRQTLDGEP